jgi:hypothetical protein
MILLSCRISGVLIREPTGTETQIFTIALYCTVKYESATL